MSIDLWDYDLEVGPKLLTISTASATTGHLAEPGKGGFLYAGPYSPMAGLADRTAGSKSNVPGGRVGRRSLSPYMFRRSRDSAG